jgi:hypothetical protein
MSAERLASLLGRITAVGAAVGIGVDRLIERASSLALLRACRIGIDGAGTQVRVLAPPESGGASIELAAHRSGTLATATVTHGEWSREDALRAATDVVALDDAALGHLLARIDTLGGPGVRIHAVVARAATAELQLAMPTPDAGVFARLVSVADALGVPGPQRDLVGGLGPVFGERSKPTMYATLHVGAGGLLPRLGVTWRAAPFDLLLRVLLGVRAGRGEVVTALSALGEEVASAFELVLQPGEPAAFVDVDIA